VAREGCAPEIEDRDPPLRKQQVVRLQVAVENVRSVQLADGSDTGPGSRFDRPFALRDALAPRAVHGQPGEARLGLVQIAAALSRRNRRGTHQARLTKKEIMDAAERVPLAADRRARQGRNPRSGESIQVPPKRVVYFKLGKELRSKLIDE
jgi:hypothetical protein